MREAEPPKRVGQYEHDQAARVLRAACKRIAGTRIGRRTTINDEALFIGHLAWAFPNEEAAIQALVRAARKTHWHGDIERTVRDAFADGSKEPRDVRRSTLSQHRKRIEEPLNFGERA